MWVPDGPVHQAGPEITTVTGSGLDEVASNIFVSSTGLLPALVEIDGAGRRVACVIAKWIFGRR